MSIREAERDQIAGLLAWICGGLGQILRDQLLGVYLYGSLGTGDFDFAISDIDLAVALQDPLDEPRFQALQGFHTRALEEYPAWENRLELAYISADALGSFRTRSSTIGIISPGEPFHLVSAGEDWLISWYALRENGIALRGPPIAAFIEPLPKSAWLEAVRQHICAYRQSAPNAPDISYLSYIVLTIARGLYTLAHGRDCSKRIAARWLADANPQWRELIERAWRIRRDPAAIKGMTEERFRAQVVAYAREMLPGGLCGRQRETLADL